MFRYRWFNRVVIEGESPNAHAEDDHEISSDDDSDDEVVKTGPTFRVGAGKVKLMTGGMQQYTDLVERKLRRREAERAKLGQA